MGSDITFTWVNAPGTTQAGGWFGYLENGDMIKISEGAQLNFTFTLQAGYQFGGSMLVSTDALDFADYPTRSILVPGHDDTFAVYATWFGANAGTAGSN
jgi:hypothetical protein